MSNRYFSPQPNVPGRGIVASYTPAFWGLVVVVGLIAGTAGGLLMLLLHALEHLAWAYDSGTFLAAVERVSPWHRVLVLLAAGLVAGLGAIGLRRMRGMGGGEIADALWLRDGHMSAGPSVSRGVLSIVVVALGASLGREGAPQLTAASLSSRLCEKAGIPRWQRRLLVACAAGAGMAAVYNIPLGGALFALEVLLGTITLPLVLPALLTTTIATALAWVVLPNTAIYQIPSYGVSATQIAYAALVGPLAGLAAVAWVRLIARIHRLRPRGQMRLPAPVLTLTGLGVLAIAYPQLLGNGSDTAGLAMAGALSVGLTFALVILKPLATAACLGSGAPGGLFTPTLTYGVLFGLLLGHLWSSVWPGSAVGSYAVIGGGAVLAASMQGPLAAIVMMIELAHHSDALVVPLLLAVTCATVVARTLGAPSLYSARLGEPKPGEPKRTAEQPSEAPSDPLSGDPSGRRR